MIEIEIRIDIETPNIERNLWMLSSTKKSYNTYCIPKYYDNLFHIYSKSEHVFDMTELLKGERRNIHPTKNLF